MENLKIGIIGGTGGIGRWFAGFFEKEGHTVHVSGRKTGMTMTAMAETCNVIIVSVPIRVTCHVIQQVGPHMREDALLMDFTSLKEEPMKYMLESSRSEVMGCHPLFGPDVQSLEGLNIGLCPGRVDKWSLWPKDVFEKRGARVVEATPKRHDEMMAIVQGLNHLNTITMGLTLNDAETDRNELEKFSTPLFTKKLAIIDKIFKNNLQLYGDIMTFNHHLRDIISLYEKNLSTLKRMIEKGDSQKVAELIIKST